MFADDTSLTVRGKIIDEIELGLNEDLDNIWLWLQANKRSLNVAKTEYVLIGSRQRLVKLSLEPNVCFGRDPIKINIPRYLKFTSMNLLHGASMLKK